MRGHHEEGPAAGQPHHARQHRRAPHHLQPHRHLVQLPRSSGTEERQQNVPGPLPHIPPPGANLLDCLRREHRADPRSHPRVPLHPHGAGTGAERGLAQDRPPLDVDGTVAAAASVRTQRSP